MEKWNFGFVTSWALVQVHVMGPLGLMFLRLDFVEFERKYMGIISRKIFPACRNMCVCCAALRSQSRQPIKRYKKLLSEIFPKSHVNEWIVAIFSQKGECLARERIVSLPKKKSLFTRYCSCDYYSRGTVHATRERDLEICAKKKILGDHQKGIKGKGGEELREFVG
ncbi:hypothetical protein LguiA_036572 [Lonicera macranthoides]